MVGVVLWARITVFVGSPLILYVQSNMCRGVPRAERENGGRVKWKPLCIVMVMKSHMVLLGRSLQKWIFASPAWLYRPSLLPCFNGFANRMCTFALLCDVCRHLLQDVLEKSCKQIIILYYGLNEIVNYPSIITERLPVGMFATFLSLLKVSSSFCCL